MTSQRQPFSGTSQQTSVGSFEFTVTAHPLEPNTNDLLGALLNAAYQQNEILSRLTLHLENQAQQPSQQQQALANWKTEHADLSQRVGKTVVHLNDVFRAWLEELIEEANELESDDPFSLREFIDKYGASYAQFAGLLSSLQNLGT